MAFGNSLTAEQMSTLYIQEIEAFEQALAISTQLLDSAQNESLEQVTKLVSEREQKITVIKTIEDKKNKAKVKLEAEQIKQYKNKITALAKKLVEIDENIFKVLQNKKVKLVQKYSNMASDTSYSRRKAVEDGLQPNIVDIRQR